MMTFVFAGVLSVPVLFCAGLAAALFAGEQEMHTA